VLVEKPETQPLCNRARLQLFQKSQQKQQGFRPRRVRSALIAVEGGFFQQVLRAEAE
jgi:hypothetical protein